MCCPGLGHQRLGCQAAAGGGPTLPRSVQLRQSRSSWHHNGHAGVTVMVAVTVTGTNPSAATVMAALHWHAAVNTSPALRAAAAVAAARGREYVAGPAVRVT